MLCVASRIVKNLQKHFQKHPPLRKLEVGIISFYSAQVSVISQLIRKGGSRLNSPTLRIKVMSVDGFQGSESDIILLSFVRSNRRNAVGFLKDFQRLNVALTRAKHHLVMVGDVATLEHSDCGDLQRLVLEMKERGVVIAEKDVLQGE